MTIQRSIQRWEELGQQLEKAIAAYLDGCRILESSASMNGAGAHTLVSRLDNRLNSFLACLSLPLASAHSSIMRTRNNVVSSAHRLPNEILSKIFYFAIYSIDVKETRHLSPEYTIRIVYQRLHALAGVCSVWRRVGLEEAFWSLVPIIEHSSGQYMPTAAQLSLSRAPNHRLYLVANLKDDRPDIEDFVVKMFSQHGPRFDSINIHSNSSESLTWSMESLLGSTSNGHFSLKDLSLCCTSLSRQPGRRPQDIKMLFDTDSPAQSAFEDLIGQLQNLHLSGLVVSFEGVSFRNLTQLTLRGVQLLNNLEFASTLRALALSSHLQTLKIVSVSVAIWTTEEDFLKGFPIILPSLQYLYMEDLLTPLLQLTLRSISPGSHLVAINWTDRSTTLEGQDPPLFPTQMWLRDFKTDVLFMSGRQNSRHPSVNVIRPVMEALPTITTLYLDSFVIDPEILDGLVPVVTNNEGPQNSGGFPKLKALHISRSHYHDPKVLHKLLKVVASHPIEELGIGIATDCFCPSYRSSKPTPDSEMELIWKSLAHAVPKIMHLPTKLSEISNVAFENHIWQLL